MDRYIVEINGQPMIIEGDNCLDAMKRAGLDIEKKYSSHNRYVGRLKDGRRFSISYHKREKQKKFHNPIPVRRHREPWQRSGER